MKIYLGIESSCDECSAAVVREDFKVLSTATYSQTQLHQPYGGVVPEVASRSHLETINTMLNKAIHDANVRFEDLEAIAVTTRPGLVGALLVGVSAAKSLAYALNKPLVAVNHLEGHAASLFLDQKKDFKYPLLLGIFSGGHSNLYNIRNPPLSWPQDFLQQAQVGRSRDDAAGEAFDKTAKLLGYPYPGGLWIDRHAKDGDPGAFDFPRALKQKSILEYSFSGLKTAVSLKVRELEAKGLLEENRANLCASIQEAIVDALVGKMKLAVQKYHCKSIAIGGGVAANSRLREKIKLTMSHCEILFPDMKYCTDNAAMIAASGIIRYKQGQALSREELLTLNANPRT